MITTNLDEMIQADLKTLKTLKAGIIPAKTFYEGIFLRTLWVYVLFVVLQLFACFVAVSVGGWASAPESFAEHFERFEEQKAPFENFISGMKIRLENRDPSLSEAEKSARSAKAAELQLQKKEAHVAKLKKIREEEHFWRVTKMFAGVFFSSLFFTLFFIGKINFAVIFKYQFQRHLRVGDYIAHKIGQAFTLYFSIFGVAALIIFNFFEQSWAVFAGVPAFILAGIVTVILMEMELSRIGVSTLMRLLTQLFREGNKPT